MAYSDYGGYAYKNGDRIADHSDIDGYHALLGNKSIQVGLYKQKCVTILKNGETLDYKSIVKAKFPEAVTDDYVDSNFFSDTDTPLELEIDGYLITIHYFEGDNYYVFASIEEPDETFWCGFSGYGVAAGLEDCGYGFSTEDQIERMKAFFKSKFKKEI